ncbi:hypothetical protein QBC47DRAFT_454635 [Echria macrotheca]|uniref:Secreted protein n=1 Tax=Echria macrotheca TaxID=438768 RepID=A0AAJ0B5N2_9PEZI|nr:hypothetical protein QBC47DRAFT_454635 [Echria macrotheca]
MHFSQILPFLTGTTAALSTPLHPRAARPASPPNDSVRISGVVFAGSGCPAGSLSGGFGSDPGKIVLNYTNFTAATGKGHSADDARKDCQLNVKLTYPKGWQFTVAKTTYRGYASLPAGAVGEAKSTYYFSGDTNQMTSSMAIKGPYEGDYSKTDENDLTGSVWSPCGSEGMINIKAEVRLQPRSGSDTASLSVTSLGGIEFTWAQCTR